MCQSFEVKICPKVAPVYGTMIQIHVPLILAFGCPLMWYIKSRDGTPVDFITVTHNASDI